MGRRVVIVGGGAREHAIALKLLCSNRIERLFLMPGNPGIRMSDPERVDLLDIGSGDIDKIESWCKLNKPDMVIVGPEDPLSRGLVDRLTLSGTRCFGPTKLAAQIECDKAWSKDFMIRHNIPTAKYKKFTSSKEAKDFIENQKGVTDFLDGYVIKASGLAAGKGVLIAHSKIEACDYVEQILDNNLFGDAGKTIIIEEFLVGEECSILAFCDGLQVRLMPAARDHKRAYNNDLGPNTGGMGAICPFDLVEFDSDLKRHIEKVVMERCVLGLKQEKSPFIGVLFAGLMISLDAKREVKVLEFNCRFGDPETQSVLPMLRTDLYDILTACLEHGLHVMPIDWATGSSMADNIVYSCGVVLADGDYPQSVTKGQLIEGLPSATKVSDYLHIEQATYRKREFDESLVHTIHAGTKFASSSSALVTNGGRVLTCVGFAASLEEARRVALEQVSQIKLEKSGYFRRDIGQTAIDRAKGKSQVQLQALTYKSCGVNIDEGNKFVDCIKSAVSQAKLNELRPGVLSQLGAFGAFFDLAATKLKDPVLVSGTDGVGTKLKLALEYDKLEGVGQDLVAMCVNDILCHGAEPLFFLDYYACGRLDLSVAERVLRGIVSGCQLARSALIGGETAEMPGMYQGGELDLAGFAVGAVERARMLPRFDEIKAGDKLVALASSGLHSNGFSLVRRLLGRFEAASVQSDCPWPSETDSLGGRSEQRGKQSLAKQLLEPTRIYCDQLRPALEADLIKSMAHITGGGILENLPRSLPANLEARLNAQHWPVSPLFGWIAREAQMEPEEMLRTFNCGLGMICVVDATKAECAIKTLASSTKNGASVHLVGELVERVTDIGGATSQCRVENFETALAQAQSKITHTLEPCRREHSMASQQNQNKQPHDKQVQQQASKVIQPKRVAILLSGTGTNARAIMEYQRRHGSNNSGYEVVLLISNKPDAPGLKYAKEYNVRWHVIDHKQFASREDFDMSMNECLRNERCELICLAGFMRLLSPKFVHLWSGRMLNIHPSLLPSFKGMHAYRQALEAGVRLTGCTVHFVSSGLDDGAIISQRAIEIRPDDTEDSLAERGKLVENQLYPEALGLLASEQVGYDSANNRAIFRTTTNHY